MARTLAFPNSSPMRDLYARLEDAGFDEQFVRAHVLPDWWDEEVANNPAGRAMGEMAIARMLGFDLAALRDRHTRLEIRALEGVRVPPGTLSRHRAGPERRRVDSPRRP